MTAEELARPSRPSAVAAESASSGSEQSAADLTELFRQHHLELVRLAALLVRSREAAEDIVQDVFVRIPFFGWIGDGRFHKLPIHGLYGSDEIVAASW